MSDVFIMNAYWISKPFKISFWHMFSRRNDANCTKGFATVIRAQVEAWRFSFEKERPLVMMRCEGSI